MSNQKPTRGNRSRKAMTSIGGDDEFSVFSTDPEAYKLPVDLGKADTQGRPEDTAVTSSVVRFFRRIFGE